MLATGSGSEFNIRNAPVGILVANMSRSKINANLGKLRGKREGKMRITGPSLATGAPPLPFHAWCR